MSVFKAEIIYYSKLNTCMHKYIVGMGRYTYLPIRYYHDTWVPIRYVLRFYLIFLGKKNLDSSSIAIRYCYVLQFLFLTLDPGKNLNDILNIQTVTKKKKTHLSSRVGYRNLVPIRHRYLCNRYH